MTRRKTSIIWTIEKEKFQEIVSQNTSLASILRYFKMSASNGSYKTLKSRLEHDNIDYSHIPLGLGSNKGREFPNKKSIPLEDILVENSTYGRGHLKRRLLKNGMLENKCSICGLNGEWNGKPLVMILDHRNGVFNDNRIENIQMVCGNCNSQLETSTGKNRRKISNCLNCGIVISKNCNYCDECRSASFFQKTNFEINKEELEKLVWEKPTVEIAKMFNVSDVAISKRCKKFGIQKPPRGYWTQFKEPKLENLKKFKPAETIDLICSCCEKQFTKKKSEYDRSVKTGQVNFYCSRECLYKMQWDNRR